MRDEIPLIIYRRPEPEPKYIEPTFRDICEVIGAGWICIFIVWVGTSIIGALL